MFIWRSIFKIELLSICSLAFPLSVINNNKPIPLSCKHTTLSESLLKNTFFLQSFNAFFSSSDKFDVILFLLVSWKRPFSTKLCFNLNWITFWMNPQRLLPWRIVNIQRQCYIFVSVTTCFICWKKWFFSKCIFKLIKINL